MDRDTAEPSVHELPGQRAREFVTRQRAVAAPSTRVYEFVWDRSAPAAGPFCTDVDGNVLLDFASHVGAAPLGYDNPKLTERLAAFDLGDPLKIAGQDFFVTNGFSDDVRTGDAAHGPNGRDDADGPTHVNLPGPVELMERLTELTSHYGMDTVFLSNSGAEAVENAIKIAYDHTGASEAITFEGAFHGRTLGALSLNRSKPVYRRGFPAIAGVHDAPFCRNRNCDRATCSCDFFPDEDGDPGSALRRLFDPEHGGVDPEDVAYLIVEPIQGEGGYYPPSDAFATEIADCCEAYNLTLIADEIQSGMGRTGEWWAADHYPIEPDIITAAKALRVGATIGRSEVFPEETGRLSSTWGGGDVVAALGGVLTIDAICEHDLLDNATARGRQFTDLLADADPESVVDVRGEGLMLAVEFSSSERRDAVLHAAFERGLLTLSCGHASLRVLPPLDVTPREITLGVDLLVTAIESVA